MNCHCDLILIKGPLDTDVYVVKGKEVKEGEEGEGKQPERRDTGGSSDEVGEEGGQTPVK